MKWLVSEAKNTLRIKFRIMYSLASCEKQRDSREKPTATVNTKK